MASSVLSDPQLRAGMQSLVGSVDITTVGMALATGNAPGAAMLIAQGMLTLFWTLHTAFALQPDTRLRKPSLSSAPTIGVMANPDVMATLEAVASSEHAKAISEGVIAIAPFPAPALVAASAWHTHIAWFTFDSRG